MTLVSTIISDAMRESNVLPLGGTPTTNESAEGLRLYNNLLLSTLGNEAGCELTDIQIGGTYDQSGFAWVPKDARLVLELGGASSLLLDPQPYEGQRVAIADAKNNLATFNLVLNANGRQIEAATTVTLNTNSLSRQWLYRADTANWVRITGLTAVDTHPFPQEFDDFFVIALALRINPRHRQSLAQESALVIQKGRNQIRARYRKRRPPNEPILGLMGQSAFGDETTLYRSG